MILFLISLTLALAQDCHPQCSWKCDDPHCAAICSPICEPPSCHVSCTPPGEPQCEVTCAAPICDIRCPEESCISQDCPPCHTDCKNPECVTRCKSQEPECQVVCDDLKCAWDCHKPECPKPKCELVCENPHCSPLLECCKCNAGQVPYTKETYTLFNKDEPDASCCTCGDHQGIVNMRDIPVFEKPEIISQIQVEEKSKEEENQVNPVNSEDYLDFSNMY